MDAAAGGVNITDRDSCDLLLSVSNQSYLDDPVVLAVVVDGVEILSQPFEVLTQHHFVEFPLILAPGTHKLTASSDTGVSLERRFTIPADRSRRYANISYYNYADEDGKLIAWHIQSRPMGIK